MKICNFSITLKCFCSIYDTQRQNFDSKLRRDHKKKKNPMSVAPMSRYVDDVSLS